MKLKTEEKKADPFCKPCHEQGIETPPDFIVHTPEDEYPVCIVHLPDYLREALQLEDK